MIRCPALLICLVVGLTFPAAAQQADYLCRLEADIVREHTPLRQLEIPMRRKILPAITAPPHPSVW